MNDNLLEVTPGRFANTLFCDDIRQETTGKLIFVGVYGNELFVSEVPQLIPSLHCVISCMTPASDPFKRIKVKVYLDDEQLTDREFMGDDSPIAEADLGEDVGQVFKPTFFLSLPPFVISKPGTLRVRVESEREILRAGTLSLLASDSEIP